MAKSFSSHVRQFTRSLRALSAPLSLTYCVSAAITTDTESTSKRKGWFASKTDEDSKGGASASTGGRRVEYKQYTYGPKHWAVNPQSCQDFGICVMSSGGHNYLVYLSPLDSKGYHLIVRLLPASNQTVTTTFNRKYTQSEVNGLFMALASMADLFLDDGLIGQVHVLGNNAQWIDEYTRNPLIGRIEEPALLHGHVIYRGDPEYEYIEGVKLDGELPGFATPIISRSDKRDRRDDRLNSVAWTQQGRQNALKYFQEKVANVCSNNKDYCKFQIIDNEKPFKAEDFVGLAQ